MNRRAFLSLVAAAIVPTRAPNTIQVPGPHWTVDPGPFYNLPQRITHAGTYQWKVRYVTVSGDTLASGGGR